VDEVEQGEDKRGALGFGDVRQRQGHAPFYAAESPAQLLSPRLIGLILLNISPLPKEAQNPTKPCQPKKG
ncbi:MAG TPA: hypothetical protein VKA46_26465, partial [Gemmataceae bacterium]|nr:hypothetical protein [Gemmataceae bacterium]